jgi:hypothetical protein
MHTWKVKNLQKMIVYYNELGGGEGNGLNPLFCISHLHQIHNRRVETQGQGGLKAHGNSILKTKNDQCL